MSESMTNELPSRGVTDERVEQLRNCLQYVTPGPWKFFDAIRPSKGHQYYGVGREAGQGRGLETLAKVESGKSFDAVFMAEAREIVPYLLARLDEVRREVRAWLCSSCHTVYPGPPQEGLSCVVCPKCGGVTAPRLTVENTALQAQVAELERRLKACGETGWAKYQEATAQIEHLRAELAILQEANDKAVEFIHAIDVEAAEEIAVTPERATAALDRLKALELAATLLRDMPKKFEGSAAAERWLLHRNEVLGLLEAGSTLGEGEK